MQYSISHSSTYSTTPLFYWGISPQCKSDCPANTDFICYYNIMYNTVMTFLLHIWLVITLFDSSNEFPYHWMWKCGIFDKHCRHIISLTSILHSMHRCSLLSVTASYNQACMLLSRRTISSASAPWRPMLLLLPCTSFTSQSLLFWRLFIAL